MTKRYYYTDPLAAAWMAKHFGMKFYAVHTDEQMADYDLSEGQREFDWFDSCPVDGWRKDIEMARDAIEYVEDISDKIFIHPDSVALLEPRVGDIVTGDNVGIVSDEVWADGELGVDYGSGLGQLPLAEDERIIQRNGIPFMWPESEEA